MGDKPGRTIVKEHWTLEETEESHSDQVRRILRNRPTRPQLMKAFQDMAAQADRWWMEAQQLAAICRQFKELVIGIHAKSEEDIERMARIMPTAYSEDDKTPPDTVH
jgi:hypothetical protein